MNDSELGSPDDLRSADAADAGDATDVTSDSGSARDPEMLDALETAGAPSAGSSAASSTDEAAIDAVPMNEAPINEANVAAFLAAHPDFLCRHPELLKTLDVALETEGAASLVSRKLRLLNDELAAQKAAHERFLQVAKSNAELQARVYTLTLSLVRAGDLQTVSEALFAALRDEFRADAVAVWLADPADQPLPALPPRLLAVAAKDARADHLAQWIEAGPRCGRFAGTTLTELFAETTIGSAVMLPFAVGSLRGLVAIGAREETRFAAGLGTETLEFLVAVAAARFERCLSAVRPAAAPANIPTDSADVAAAPISDQGESQSIGAAAPPATPDDGPD